MQKNQASLKSLVITFIRIMLAFAIVGSLIYGRSLIFIIGILALCFTFVPLILQRFFGIRFPAEFEVIVLLFLYGLLTFWGVRGFGTIFWWWDPLLTFGASVILGFVGLTLFYIFEKEGIIEASSFVIVFFAFCFAFSLGAMWEVFEFFIDTLFGFGLQRSLAETMFDLIVMLFGTFCVSFFGFIVLRKETPHFASKLISDLVRKNRRLFHSKKYFEYSSHAIARLIAQGEGDTLEFKSTLRKNIHTNVIDKHIEHAILKTIVGYLNSSGGTLLVGVKDDGAVCGLEADEFESHDKLKLYVTNMIRRSIGNHFLPFISYELFPFHDKHVLKIDCKPSSKRTFLKWNNEEEFYVRHGSSTIQLSGSDLLDYVAERF